ncbi:DNA (cytosine-5)-methyltransferase 3B-like isoform X2 [Impatiens glandulifera]|uniref:DNA (cytosine-5)-methyltransferase 3B-like isoform X2 n=1 Tax=Impatiens glandulifera TaxID=253017 RepID=UPI001FB1257A|nr:DNA (cytosine-5)-methyltransferase 3B-like isoform X2 [Impatiens glandulifera]
MNSLSFLERGDLVGDSLSLAALADLPEPAMSSSNRSLKEVGKKSGGKTDCSLNEVALGDIIWIKSRRLSWWPAQVADPSAVSKNKKPRKKSSSQVLVRIYGSYIYKYVDPVICRSEFKKILDQNNGSYSSIFEKNLERDMCRSQSGITKRKVSSSKDKKTQTTEAATPKKIKPNDFSPSTDMGRSQSGSRKRKVTSSKDKKTQTTKAATPKKIKPNDFSPSNDMDHSKSGSRKRKVSSSKDKKTQITEAATPKKIKPNDFNPSNDMGRSQSGGKKRKLSNSKDKKTAAPKKLKPNDISPSTGNSLAEKSQGVSARRIKIMQSLGLIAPLGSPFSKV